MTANSDRTGSNTPPVVLTFLFLIVIKKRVIVEVSLAEV